LTIYIYIKAASEPKRHIMHVMDCHDVSVYCHCGVCCLSQKLYALTPSTVVRDQ